MEHKTKIDLTPYIVNVKGKDFITLNGLLAEAHAVGIQSMNTEFVNNDITNPVFKTTVILKDGRIFTGWGDSNSKNVAPMVSNCLIRMSESRSVSRCLRFALNINMVAIEELSGNDEDVITNNKPQTSFTNKASTTTFKSSTKTEPSETKKFPKFVKSEFTKTTNTKPEV